jgi:hypothetical protein
LPAGAPRFAAHPAITDTMNTIAAPTFRMPPWNSKHGATPK